MAVFSSKWSKQRSYNNATMQQLLKNCANVQTGCTEKVWRDFTANSPSEYFWKFVPNFALVAFNLPIHIFD